MRVWRFEVSTEPFQHKSAAVEWYDIFIFPCNFEILWTGSSRSVMAHMLQITRHAFCRSFTGVSSKQTSKAFGKLKSEDALQVCSAPSPHTSHLPLVCNPIMSRRLFFACNLVHRWKMDSWVIETCLHCKRTLQESLNDSRHLTQTSATNLAVGPTEAALATDEAMPTCGCSKFATTSAKWLPSSRLWC